ncbi:hypothetical protein HYH03_001784 [Edaphochlamys debaryana]|uniref:PPM-type phosphatase domain-containing protein n=1 Tax=Edaphochlamys debaryana TaxID=47281 RepID=A0A835YED3_9CHLO|nr:hypothetical protein HYH03_001784 [Edaphochlamys debaryana]|eukprot:KAG2500204.1 hypothetical protein HYH03_001784 [Edaphochlamys debaryana]
MVWEYFRKLGAKLREQSAARKLEAGTICGKQGAEATPPEANLHLSKPNLTIVASHSGPDNGVAVYRQFAPDLQATWENSVDWAYGVSVSMYDLGPTGRRNGEPVADCFGIIAYPDGAILAVADGVNWGEPPRRAARCAVLGCLNHLHNALKHHEGDSTLDSNMVFRHMTESIGAAQKLILQQFGTLTTLVVTVVLPLKWVRAPGRWAAMTLTVGDSAAYVYRAASRTVEEVTAAAHAEGARDPRWCPGALGYAMGEDPDLANMMMCLTFLDEGDYVFLTSDGVADNFDPVIRKMARHQILESNDNELPALSPAECQAKAMDLLRGAIIDADRKLSSGEAAHGTVTYIPTPASTPASGVTPGHTPGAGSGGLPSGPGGGAGGSGSPSPSRQGHEGEEGGEGGAGAGLSGVDSGEGLGGAGSSGLPSGSAAASSSSRRNRHMTARGLAEQLLQHVYEVTEEQRTHVEARNRERERGLSRGEGGDGPSLGTDNKHGGLMGMAPAARPPGKMDHATVAAYQVGRRKASAVLKAQARSSGSMGGPGLGPGSGMSTPHGSVPPAASALTASQCLGSAGSGTLLGPHHPGPGGAQPGPAGGAARSNSANRGLMHPITLPVSPMPPIDSAGADAAAAAPASSPGAKHAAASS